MINTTYTVTIDVAKSPGDVFNFIIDLKKWWVEEFIGEELKLYSEFELKVGEGHHSKNKVIEFIPNKKFTWITTESKRVADNFDWTGTKMIFELSPKAGGTQITFTYDGVIFENEQDKLKDICDYCIKNLLYKNLESFATAIQVAKSRQEVFNSLTEVNKWWNSDDFEGSSKELNDEFIIHHPEQHYSKQKLIEVIPGEKIVWLVTDSTLYWLQNDKQEWTNTKMIFEISKAGNKTNLHFTHEGLTPGKECYTMCEKGWTMIITDWLFYFITYGTPSPQMNKATEIRNRNLLSRSSLRRNTS